MCPSGDALLRDLLVFVLLSPTALAADPDPAAEFLKTGMTAQRDGDTESADVRG